MISVLKTRPDEIVADYSSSHVGKGEGYQERFSALKGRSTMWALEKRAIKEILANESPSEIIDFAAGTGRISGILRETFPRGRVTGIDISPSMLEVARSNVAGVEFLLMDGREAISHFGERSVDLVTAFRFFPNADFPLREAASEQIADLVKPGGALLINNHRNFWSLSYILNRARPRAAAPGALNADIIRLFCGKGFTLERKLSLGVWPQTEGRSALLPWKIVSKIERINLRYFAGAHGVGYNMLYLFRRNS